MSGNAGEDMLKLFIRIIIFILKLLPGLFKLIFKGIMAIINAFNKKKNVEEPPVE